MPLHRQGSVVTEAAEHHVEIYITDDARLRLFNQPFGWQCFTCNKQVGKLRTWASAEEDAQKHRDQACLGKP
jgi:hypothetical protein